MTSKLSLGNWNQETLELKYSRKSREPEELWNVERLKTKLLPKNILNSVLSFVPIIHWLPNYDWKRNLNADIIEGLNVGIMDVSRGMAYANLAALPPIYGIYSSFFTSVIYMFFGTSKDISIGVYALTSLMVGAVKLRFIPNPDMRSEAINGTKMETMKAMAGSVEFGYEVTPIMLISALTITVGLFQLVMAIMGLASLTAYLSNALIGGFSTGCAFHVVISQLNEIIDVKLPRYSCFGMLYFMVRDVVKALPKINYCSLCISIFSMIFLSIGRDCVNPWFKKRSPTPLPAELILVILATAFSSYMDLRTNYHVRIVNYIPQGIPKLSLPKFDLIPYLLGDSFAIAVVSYMFIISKAKLFAKNRHYKVDITQELCAVGMMHTLSSFFPVYPGGPASSRSFVCKQSGANTQLHILFKSIVLLTVIVSVGPLLESLPMCVLACIVIASLKSVFIQFRELPRLWRISKFDFAVWLVCCVATTSFDVMTGLKISVMFMVISVVLRKQWPKIFVMGRTPDHEIYKPLTYYKNLKPVKDDVKIIRFEAPLSFVNVAAFLEKMEEIFHDGKYSKYELEIRENSKRWISGTTKCSNYKKVLQKEEVIVVEETEQKPENEALPTEVVIIDCGAITNIDAMGIEAFKEVYFEGGKANKEVIFANLSETVLNVFERIDFYSSVPKSSFYPSVEQAALASTTND